MPQLTGKKVAVVATDGVEEAEIVEPVKALKAAGADVTVLSLDTKPIQMFKHHDKTSTFPVDRPVGEADPNAFDAVMLPGGALNADAMRAEPSVLSFVRAVGSAGKPIAAICHAPWELISAGLVRGRTLTSYHTIKDDIVNAGGNWVDREVVDDANLVTSRKPSDIPRFNEHMLAMFEKTPARV